MASPTGSGRWPWLLAALGAGALLVCTNPGEQEFEAFAGEQLVELAGDALCNSDGLPLMARLVVQNCPALIRSQRGVLGRLAAEASRRYNLGLFSLYSTQLGGLQLMPGLSIPRYQALTLAGAGHLVVLRTASDTRSLQP